MENAENFSREEKLLWYSICDEIKNRPSLVEFLDEMILKENLSYMEVQHTDEENNVNIKECQHSSSQNNYMTDEEDDNLLNYMTEEQVDNIQNYMTEEQVDNIQNYMTEEQVDNLQNYMTEEQVDNLQNYMTEEQVDNLQNYMTEEQVDNLQNYMTEEQLDNLQNYMTEEDFGNLLQNSSSHNYYMREEQVDNLRQNLSSLNDYMSEDDVDDLRQIIDDLIAYCQDTSKGAEAEIARIKIAISSVHKALTINQVEPTYLGTVKIGLLLVELSDLRKGLPKNRQTIQPERCEYFRYEPHLPTMISPDSEMPLDLRKYTTTRTKHAQTHH